jgi:hypothetical protein
MSNCEDAYTVWARALVDRFFGLHMENQRARLIITEEILNNDFPHLGGYTGFLSAVISGPGFIGFNYEGNSKFHGHAMALYKQWRLQLKSRYTSCFLLPDNAPLYLPHLAALCLAWSTGSNDQNSFAPNAFYDRLTEIIPEHGLSTSKLKEWTNLWNGLESWTKNCKFKRGRFDVEVLGNFCYVGIPLSQVFITPEKISRLPELFVVSGLADVWKPDWSNTSQIRQILLANSSLTCGAIGRMLFQQIQNENSSIGNSVIKRLLEFLQDAEFRVWYPNIYSPSTTVREQGFVATSLKVRLVLESKASPASWRCCLGLLGVDPPSNPSSEVSWLFSKVDERLGGLWLAVNKNNQSEIINAKMCNLAIEAGFSYNFLPPPERDEDLITLKLPSRRVRIFHENGWLGQRLVEEDSFPEQGGCFLLVSQKSIADLTHWLHIFKQRGGIVNDYTLQGLPAGNVLLHLSKVELAGNELIDRFPEKSIAQKSPQKVLYFRGGSQIQGTGNQNLYLPYDPPDVVLVAPQTVNLSVKGASVVEINPAAHTWSTPEGLSGYGQRQYYLDVEPEANQVRISALSNDSSWIPVVETFGIGRESTLGLNFSEAENPRFDNLGIRTNSNGIFGGIFLDSDVNVENTNLIKWNFLEHNLELGNLVNLSNFDFYSWRLMESISQVKKITAQEFRRRCERILKWWPQYAWAEARWLRALCHVEVERDNRGRIAYVYSVPAHSYLLPWKNRGRWLACIAGCPSEKVLRKLIEQCAKFSIEIYSKDRGCALLPPRWLCCSNDLSSIKTAFNNAGILLETDCNNPYPLCAIIAGWAGSLKDWKNGLNWLDGPAPEGEAEFNPRRFRIAKGEKFNCPCRLISIVDSLTNKHRWNILSHRRIDQKTTEIVPRHAFLTDEAWGKWYSMSIIASEFSKRDLNCQADLIPFPFSRNMQNLDVPATLVFPTMICRAILTTIGMPPIILKNGSEFYSSDNSRFAPDGHAPYSGACLRYENAYPKIVELIFQKLRAKMILI